MDFTDKPTEIQINVSARQEGSFASARLISDYLADGAIGEHARKLILAVKFFLKMRGMHSRYQGFPGSYATALMVLFFLKVR